MTSHLTTVLAAATVAAQAMTAAAQESPPPTEQPSVEILERPQPSVKVTTSSTTSAGTASRDVFAQPQLLTDLLDADVLLQDGDAAGEVSNLVIGPRGTIQYLVATHEGRNYLIPFRALNFNAEPRTVQLPLTPEQFDDVVFFEGRNLPDLTSVAVRRQMSALFGVREINTARLTGTREAPTSSDSRSAAPPAERRTREVTSPTSKETREAEQEDASTDAERTANRPRDRKREADERIATPRSLVVPPATRPRSNTAGGASPRRPGGTVPATPGGENPNLPGGPRPSVPGGPPIRPPGPTTPSTPAPRFPNTRQAPAPKTPGGPPIAPPAGVTPNASPGQEG